MVARSPATKYFLQFNERGQIDGDGRKDQRLSAAPSDHKPSLTAAAGWRIGPAARTLGKRRQVGGAHLETK
jgi:hypothetical protein